MADSSLSSLEFDVRTKENLLTDLIRECLLSPENEGKVLDALVDLRKATRSWADGWTKALRASNLEHKRTEEEMQEESRKFSTQLKRHQEELYQKHEKEMQEREKFWSQKRQELRRQHSAALIDAEEIAQQRLREVQEKHANEIQKVILNAGKQKEEEVAKTKVLLEKSYKQKLNAILQRVEGEYAAFVRNRKTEEVEMEQSFQQEIENLKKDLFESQGRIDALKEQLESTKCLENQLRDRVAQNEAALTQALNEKNFLNERISELKKELQDQKQLQMQEKVEQTDSQRELDALKLQYESTLEKIEKRVRRVVKQKVERIAELQNRLSYMTDRCRQLESQIIQLGGSILQSLEYKNQSLSEKLFGSQTPSSPISVSPLSTNTRISSPIRKNFGENVPGVHRLVVDRKNRHERHTSEGEQDCSSDPNKELDYDRFTRKYDPLVYTSVIDSSESQSLTRNPNYFASRSKIVGNRVEKNQIKSGANQNFGQSRGESNFQSHSLSRDEQAVIDALNHKAQSNMWEVVGDFAD